ncbi:MAG: hypothetical protein IPN65_08775 [Elusimicrobia bacterium]|jgi:hypothetical protein|nr:hypothetical protein [Elusimicrobiota bacterium]MBK7207887.1 hypothetical protein [Elusimicrobiota bacterium]MBK7544652.1 hypothetical protein [Elusimicrobiota bacterium]MBK7574184.1 hypothetical protein [Elusimicrobiota bacterium]MBK7688875.1 hypothetical protein [Elusimicrobiota bacterium]
MFKNDWITDQILRAAGELERAGGTVRAFQRTVAERLSDQPLTAWELAFWTRGVRRGLIALNSHWFRLGSGRRSSFGFFVRNEAGLTVGLRRESLTQAAVYAALITHYGYPRARTRFESEFLDVALRDERGAVSLYAETKASDRVLEKLAVDLSTGYHDGLPPLVLAEGQKPPDAHQKAAHILRTRPDHFWAVSPNRRLAFAVRYVGRGFGLSPVEDIPMSARMDLFSMA